MNTRNSKHGQSSVTGRGGGLEPVHDAVGEQAEGIRLPTSKYPAAKSISSALQHQVRMPGSPATKRYRNRHMRKRPPPNGQSDTLTVP